jgi:hypothetical protein
VALIFTKVAFLMLGREEGPGPTIIFYKFALHNSIEMRFGICPLSIIPVRSAPNHRSEMVTQLLFGESFIIQEAGPEWLFIRGAIDGYEGWISKGNIVGLDEEPEEGIIYPAEVTGSLTWVYPAERPADTLLLLPGSTLPGLKPESGEFMLGESKYLVKGQVEPKPELANPHGMESTALEFMNAPYLWGGRSLFGIDCSGFTQVVYKICGIPLPRDAGQQVKKGTAVNFVSESVPGDLAFFGESEEEITHVGIILDGGRIIHASGKVRIDRFDHQGIFVKEKGTYSHSLRVIHNYL